MKQSVQTESSPSTEEARAALSSAKANLAKTKAVGHKVSKTVEWLEQQRDENHFAEAILNLIVDGRGGR